MPHKTRINPSAAALWASAFVILALVIVQAGRLPANMAHAGMANSGAGYTLVTSDSGFGDDANPYELLYVIDNRDQVLLVYEVEDAQTGQIFVRDGGSLVTLFNNARR